MKSYKNQYDRRILWTSLPTLYLLIDWLRAALSAFNLKAWTYDYSLDLAKVFDTLSDLTTDSILERLKASFVINLLV